MKDFREHPIDSDKALVWYRFRLPAKMCSDRVTVLSLSAGAFVVRPTNLTTILLPIFPSTMPSEDQITTTTSTSAERSDSNLTVEEYIRNMWEREILRTNEHATRRIDEFRAEAELVRKQLAEIR